MYSQGDVLVIQISHLPDRLTKLATSVVLQGEAMGHAHRIVNGQLYDNRW
jgi:predicted SpoU family rRNA methylase